jgi:hypothetical protein
MRAALVLSLALAACGFLPEDSFTGKRIGDGIAPWTDLGPVLVCFGSESLGPPTSTPGGFCSSINTTEAPCVDDGDCRSRESCMCGRCTVAYCTASSDCGGGRVCTFTENRCDVSCANQFDCADGEECFNGTCRGRCFSDEECQSGEVCNSESYCITVDCADSDACQSGESCKVQRVPRQALEPTALVEDAPTRVVLWLELADEGQLERRRIWRAVSNDGRSFRIDPAQPVLDDGLDTRAPSVVRTPTGFAMYYEWNAGAEIRVATSADGTRFGTPTTAIVGGTGAAAARAPAAVVLPDGKVAVYYQIGDGAAVGLAVGPVGEALATRDPVLTPEKATIEPSGRAAPFWDDITALRSPSALLTDSPDGASLRLWFSGFGRESADTFEFGEMKPVPANHSIGYAAGSLDALDTVVPWPYGPVVDRVDAFLDHREELTPGVVRLGGDDAYLLYYVEATPAMDADGAAGPFVIGRLGVLGNGAYEAVTGP